MFGLLLKVVAEVDEMCLFHQLGYESEERRWPQSTIAVLSDLKEIRVRRAYVDYGLFSAALAG